MKPERIEVARSVGIAAFFLLALLLGNAGCSVQQPYKYQMYAAVEDYFYFKGPYTAMIGPPQMDGELRSWPLEVHPLNSQEEFKKAYPGRYFIFRNEFGEWEVAPQ